MNGKSLNITDQKLAALRGVLPEAFAEIDAATVTDILAAGPSKVIALDRLFQGDDQLKTNTGCR